MPGRLLRLHDDTMGRQICLWTYGHFGAPILVFPSASGMAHEWDAHGMIEAHADLINRGKVKLYCVESNVSESWTDKSLSPAQQLRNHLRYERFVLDTLVPYIYEDCRTPGIPLAVTGVSVGAYMAVTFALRHPTIFRYALGLSGRYDLTYFTGGRSDSDLYFHNPMAFVPGLDGEPLEQIRKNTRIALVCGRGRWEDGNFEETYTLGKLLDRKKIPNTTDIWGRDSDHQWPWWKIQSRLYFRHEFDR